MRKNLGGGSREIEARLKAYDEAIKAGASKEEAMKAAKEIKKGKGQ